MQFSATLIYQTVVSAAQRGKATISVFFSSGQVSDKRVNGITTKTFSDGAAVSQQPVFQATATEE